MPPERSPQPNSTTSAPALSPRVYISYSARTPQLKRKALWLADTLREAGIDSRLDTYCGKALHGFTPPPPLPNRDAWDAWQEEQVALADRVIIFCSEPYASAPPNSGVDRDVRYMQQDAKTSPLSKFIPVGLGTYVANIPFIPKFIAGANFYDIGKPQKGNFGVPDLIRALKPDAPEDEAPVAAQPRRPQPKRSQPTKKTATKRGSTMKASDLKGKVHAAIITIRPDEYEAMESKLGDLTSVTGRNTYKHAVITPQTGDPINVVVTRLVRQGNSPAQAVTSNIIEELDPAWIILVGIGGGVPDNEFSLGDVALATYLHDFSMRAASTGKTTYETGGGNMHRDVERFLATRVVGADGKTLRHLAGFDTDPDLLNHPTVYPDGVASPDLFYGSDGHRKWVMKTIEHRFPNGKRPLGPISCQGPCANGNVLLKDEALLNQWQESARQLIQVEMELSGVYESARTAGRENYPVLAIRGISDIVGFARDPNWTGYACKSAAAFTAAILRSGFIDFSKNLPVP